MCLRVALRDRVGDRDADAAADVAQEVEDAAGVAGAALGNGAESDLGQGHKDHGESHAGEGQRPEESPGPDVEGEVAQPDAGDAERAEAECDDPARIELGDGGADQQRGSEGADAARADGEAGLGGRVAEQVLEEDGQDGGEAVQDATQAEDEEAAPGKVAIGERAEIDQRFGCTELVDDVRHKEGHKQDHGPGNADVAEPVLLLAFVENVLQAGYPDAEQTEADAVELAGFCVLYLRWILENAGLEKHGHNTDGDVDVESPAPGDSVGEEAAEGRADDGGQNNTERIDAKGLALLFGREAINEDGLGKRLQRAAAGALQGPGHKDEGERRCDAAKKRGEGEDAKGDDQVTFAAEALGKVVAGEQKRGVGDEVDGKDPLGLVGGGGGGTGDIGHRDGGDRGVHDLHKRGQHDGHGDEPGIDLGFTRHGVALRRSYDWMRGANGREGSVVS